MFNYNDCKLAIELSTPEFDQNCFQPVAAFFTSHASLCCVLAFCAYTQTHAQIKCDWVRGPRARRGIGDEMILSMIDSHDIGPILKGRLIGPDLVFSGVIHCSFEEFNIADYTRWISYRHNFNRDLQNYHRDRCARRTRQFKDELIARATCC